MNSMFTFLVVVATFISLSYAEVERCYHCGGEGPEPYPSCTKTKGKGISKLCNQTDLLKVNTINKYACQTITRHHYPWYKSCVSSRTPEVHCGRAKGVCICYTDDCNGSMHRPRGHLVSILLTISLALFFSHIVSP